MRLIDADKIDIRKWFVVPADIQRIQAMLDETETVSGITLAELLQTFFGYTDCEVWSKEGRFVKVAMGTASQLIREIPEAVRFGEVAGAYVEGDKLVVHMDGGEEDNDEDD